MPFKNKLKRKQYASKWYRKNYEKLKHKYLAYRRQNHEKIKLKNREYYKKNRKKMLCYQKKYQKKNKEKVRIYLLKYRNKNRKRIKQFMAKYHYKNYKRIRKNAISHYSHGKLSCACCGENEDDFLTIDHIKNDGAKHRKRVKSSIYMWLAKNNFPSGYQVLCWNCNLGRSKHWNNGVCPHKRTRSLVQDAFQGQKKKTGVSQKVFRGIL